MATGVIGLSPGAQTGMRFEAPEKMVRTTTFDRVRRGGYVPEEHLKDMDAAIIGDLDEGEAGVVDQPGGGRMRHEGLRHGI